ncbi:MAG: hypothetical protein QXS79_01770 [Candidatus Bathyarchaeia archaeon]
MPAGKNGFPVVLTADRTLFSDCSGFGGGDFLACLPSRLIPKFILNYFLCPRISSKDGKAILAPYSLRKIEAILTESGFEESEVAIANPDDLSKVIGITTVIAMYCCRI